MGVSGTGLGGAPAAWGPLIEMTSETLRPAQNASESLKCSGALIRQLPTVRPDGVSLVLLAGYSRCLVI
jgi:hypothetical protein